MTDFEYTIEIGFDSHTPEVSMSGVCPLLSRKLSILTNETKIEYVCEVCDKTETLTEAEAVSGGWDYPPFIGAWVIISPRTCGDCGIQDTLWWVLMMDGVKDEADLSDRHKETLQRILSETEGVENGG